MKRVDIVDVKADIRDGQLEIDVNKYGEILLRDIKSGEAVKLGELGIRWVKE